MWSRIYTITYDPRSKSARKYGKKSIPRLRFSGFWLTRVAGMHIGDKVRVLADDGKIGILRIGNGKGVTNEDTANTNTGRNGVASQGTDLCRSRGDTVS